MSNTNNNNNSNNINKPWFKKFEPINEWQYLSIELQVYI
jgi:hypothetical protein